MDNYKCHDYKVGLTKQKAGFTLLEVILCILIVGILGAVAGMGITNIVRAYDISRTNSETFHRGQLAMTRIAKELKDPSTEISSGGSELIRYDREGIERELSFDADSKSLYFDSDILSDHIVSFELTYYSAYDSVSISSFGSINTRIVQVILKYEGAGNHIATFQDRVYIGK
ncbi:type II secretion system protein [Desulfobacterales bacterium HSG16]|nr:type II secretion system protein [Desulfobacterales bacterium HSG16]